MLYWARINSISQASENVNMKLRILVEDVDLKKELLLVEQKEEKLKLSENCYITPLQEYEESFGLFGVPEILEFSVFLSSNVAIGLLTNWLYDLIKSKKVREAELDGKKLPSSSEEIETIIQELFD